MDSYVPRLETYQAFVKVARNRTFEPFAFACDSLRERKERNRVTFSVTALKPLLLCCVVPVNENAFLMTKSAGLGKKYHKDKKKYPHN